MPNNIIHIAETSSTSTLLKEMRKNENVVEGVTVWADYQISGRGQRGNSWESEQGKNLLFSTILYPDFVLAEEQFLLSQVASLAIKYVLDAYTENITVKWPNDIYWKDRKICGMLIENVIMGNSITESVLGIGININQEFFVSDAPNPISLKQITQVEYNRELILTQITEKIFELYNQAKINRYTIINSYKQCLYRKNGLYSYKDEQGCVFNAYIEDVEPLGLLVLKTEEGIVRKFAFKEVKFL